MKKLLCLLAVVLIFNACNTIKNKDSVINDCSDQDASNYEGVYKGTYPCADCSGIQVNLALNSDNTFVYKVIYLDEEDGRFVHKGKYTVKESILTIQEDSKPVHFLVGENTLTLLGHGLKPNTGELTDYYKLKKQGNFDYEGKYETFNEENGGYTQTLSIKREGKNYKVVFSASIVKNKENCIFSGVGSIKNDTIRVNLSKEKNNEILMYIAPSHDNLGVEVFTKNLEERFAIMSYCGGGASLAGKYMKNTITANSIGVFNNHNTIAEVLQTLPNTQIKKRTGHGEFFENVYDDYEIYNHDNQLLFTLTPKETGYIDQKINRVLVDSPFFKTGKGIHKNSTYKNIKAAYKINKIESTRDHIVLIVDELNANFSISKNKLKQNWWNNEKKKVNETKIPLNTQIDSFVLWWND